MKIEDVEGIGPGFAQKLTAAGVDTVEKLLECGATPNGRTELAKTTEISAAKLLEWVNHADLMRVKGVGSEYADLLEATGVDSPAELAQRKAANLATKMDELNAAKNIVRRVPNETAVQGWIDEAKTMKKIVEH